MSVRWITWAWDQPCANAGAKLTLIALADHAGETGAAFPGCARLAEKTNQDERTIRRHLDALEAAGFLSRERRRRPDGTLGTYTYQLTDRPPDNLTTGQIVTDQRTSVSGRPADIGVRAEPSSLNRQEEPSVSLLVASDERFEEFWALYRKTGPRKKAKEGWDRALKRPDVTPERLISAIMKWMVYWDSPGAAKIKWPQGWFTDERWADEPPRIQQQAKLSTGGGAIQRRLERTS